MAVAKSRILWLIVVTLLPLIACAEDAGQMTATPDVIARVVRALSESKVDELTSKTTMHEGREYSYHLKTVDYLGAVTRDERRYTVAAAKFLRSSAKESAYPPARGHGFILLLDESFRIVSHARLDYAAYSMKGEVLMCKDTVLVDFSAHDELTRYRGWMVDGVLMPYPFADKITEAEWESGSFRKKP